MAVALLALSCGDDDDSSSQVTVTLQSQSIKEGAEVDAASTTEITLTYNVPVRVAHAANITLNGKKMEGTSRSSDMMGITVPVTLAEGISYTLLVPSGSVLANSDGRVSAPSFTLNFKTREGQLDQKGQISMTPLTTNAAAVTLYKYFYKQYGEKVISSVMANVNWNNDCAKKVHALTGKYPAMNCYDFIHIYVPKNNWIDYTNISPVKEWADAGGIVQLMWHFNVPKSATTTPGADGSGVTCTPSETTFKAANALKDGTWENKWFYQQMDKVVAVMLQLKQAGIAATWRPFHEAAGNATAKQQADWTKSWFWWGYDGAEVYKRLWTTMYDYFQQKGVDNLIWIWTTQNFNGNSAQYRQDTDWYPGDAYVDIVARDLYGCNAAQNAQEFREIQAAYPNKMVVLGECGYGTVNKTRKEQGNIGDCWTAGAKWSHFMVWYQGSQGSTDTMCSDDWWKSVMSSANVITRDQLPALK